ncbi:hypothetical protein CMO92_00750 [Candidatus Woesearchaeota archaeon]|mgnify:CR=1 FL=1|nr:hypothetical protein [Candidatus Woesearchaeota archaeon]|tara:strand:- start:134 stop:370 length:237 start_codon:yes stop_codon:yes gene_type:complete
MIATDTKLKAWGNSVGIVLPKKELQEEGLEIDDEVEITIKKKTNVLREVFGTLKGVKRKTDKTTDELLKEIDEELDPN